MKCTGQSTATYSQPVTKSQKFDGLSQTRDNDLDTSSISGSWERQDHLITLEEEEQCRDVRVNDRVAADAGVILGMPAPVQGPGRGTENGGGSDSEVLPQLSKPEAIGGGQESKDDDDLDVTANDKVP